MTLGHLTILCPVSPSLGSYYFKSLDFLHPDMIYFPRFKHLDIGSLNQLSYTFSSLYGNIPITPIMPVLTRIFQIFHWSPRLSLAFSRLLLAVLLNSSAQSLRHLVLKFVFDSVLNVQRLCRNSHYVDYSLEVCLVTFLLL